MMADIIINPDEGMQRIPKRVTLNIDIYFEIQIVFSCRTILVSTSKRIKQPEVCLTTKHSEEYLDPTMRT